MSLPITATCIGVNLGSISVRFSDASLVSVITTFPFDLNNGTISSLITNVVGPYAFSLKNQYQSLASLASLVGQSIVF